MPTSNTDLIKRADLALSDLSANGGLLLPEQANAFIDLVLDQPTILAQVRQERMTGPEKRINRIGFSSRILRAALQTGSSLDAGGNDRYVRAADRAKPTTNQIILNSKEVIAEIRLPYEALEDNIEGESLESHIMRLIAERAAIDLEELVLAGDTTSGDAYLALMDGYMKRITSHIVNNASLGCKPDMFVNGMLAMPQKYLRNLNQLKHFISVANTIRYRQFVSNRATGYGDSMLVSGGPIYAAGVAVEAAPMLSVVGTGNSGLLTYPKNLIFGIQRDVRMETDKDIRSREFIIVLTARVAVQIEDENATVKYTNI